MYCEHFGGKISHTVLEIDFLKIEYKGQLSVDYFHIWQVKGQSRQLKRAFNHINARLRPKPIQQGRVGYGHWPLNGYLYMIQVEYYAKSGKLSNIVISLV